MKKVVALIAMVAVLFASGAAYAADAPDTSALEKLGRGAANIITCVIEIPYRIGEANNEDGIFAACTVGLVTGVFRTGYRAVVGAFEVITFPIPIPEGYKPIITDPEYFFQDSLY
ncbi:exosortase system-associated protein, TIGR04073 family [Candidatus Omnitrophota bacterium]